MAVAHNTLTATEADRGVAAVASPHRVLFVIWVSFWLIMILVAVQEQLRNPDVRWWEPLLWEGSSLFVATIWMVVQRRVRHRYARYLDQPLRWFGHHLRWLPLLIVSFIGGVFAIRHGVYALTGEIYEHWPWPFVFVYEAFKVVMFTGLWLGIIFGFDSFEQWQAQRRHLLELQKSLAEAQLSQLKAQLRPHFFFNALNTISSLMHVDVERADRLLARLGDLLRVSLQSSGQELTSLREELHTLELFAQIMQERFADRVFLAWKIDPQALEAKVPVMLLQPLLENAFKHGVERSVDHVSITVSARLDQESLIIEMCNTGSTLVAGYREGVGLRNCRERLNVIYGGAAALQMTSDANSVTATVTLPRDAAS